jgi:hypothetical protein
LTQPRLLIISFSPIASDARVLKQVEYFSTRYRVTTCGYGEAPRGVERHIRIPDTALANDLNGRYITLRRYGAVYRRIGAVAWCLRELRAGEWDIVLANDVETVPIALRLRPALGVHADLHEYSPRLKEEIPAWRKRIKPFYDWLCRRYVARADSWTTVSGGLAGEFAREFGFEPTVVTNAAPYAELKPGGVGSPIRLVHSGACLRNRNLAALIEGVATSSARVTLDLYLAPNDPGYLDELRNRAGQLEGVTVHDAVPYRDLVTTLNGFDVGVHILPPVNFNNEWALPNKLFDYVQARLGVIVGPSKEMRSYVEDRGIGAVSADFSSDGFAVVLDDLDPRVVDGWKKASDASARELSAEAQVEIWGAAIARLAERPPR